MVTVIISLRQQIKKLHLLSVNLHFLCTAYITISLKKQNICRLYLEVVVHVWVDTVHVLSQHAFLVYLLPQEHPLMGQGHLHKVVPPCGQQMTLHEHLMAQTDIADLCDGCYGN